MGAIFHTNNSKIRKLMQNFCQKLEEYWKDSGVGQVSVVLVDLVLIETDAT